MEPHSDGAEVGITKMAAVAARRGSHQQRRVVGGAITCPTANLTYTTALLQRLLF